MTLREYIRTHQPGPFKPGAVHYNALGDFLEVYWSDEECYGEWVSQQLTVMRNAKHEVVGVKIYGVRDAMKGGG